MLLRMAWLCQPSCSEISGRDGKPIQVETPVGMLREAGHDPATSSRLADPEPPL